MELPSIPTLSRSKFKKCHPFVKNHHRFNKSSLISDKALQYPCTSILYFTDMYVDNDLLLVHSLPSLTFMLHVYLHAK